MDEKQLLQSDKWLSSLVGHPTFRLNLSDAALEKGSQTKDEIEKGQNGSVFIYTKIPAQRTDKVHYLEQLGFWLIDTNVQFERTTDPSVPLHATGIRFAKPEDEEPVVEVARNAFVYSRFHLDQNISRDIADKIKAEWARNFFKGARGEYMVVATEHDKAVGFLQLLKSEPKTLVIDLIAVSERHRGQKMAQSMIYFAERSIPEIENIIVGTQVANIPSVRFYETMGFKLKSASYVLHYHRQGNPSKPGKPTVV